MADSNNRRSILNVLKTLRGTQPVPKSVKTKPQQDNYTVSSERRNKILSHAIEATAGETTRGSLGFGAVESLVRSVFSNSGNKTIENKQILKIFTDIDKGCRLIVASQFSPTDLSRSTIPITFDAPALPPENMADLNARATDFFEKRLNLKTMGPKWTHKALFTAGATVLTAIPVESYRAMLDSVSSMGTESMSVSQIATVVAAKSLYDFTNDVAGVESFTKHVIDTPAAMNIFKPEGFTDANFSKFVRDVIGTEALDFTDQTTVLKSADIHRSAQSTKRARRRAALNQTTSIVPHTSTETVTGNPIFMDIPMEAVALLFPPSDPENPVAAIVLLDENGVPVLSSTLMSEKQGFTYGNDDYSKSAFTDISNAYGLQSGMSTTPMDMATIYDLYQTVVSSYVLDRAGKAGFDAVDIGTVDSVFRCMFHRFLAKKQTRVLLIPKEFFTYYAFEVDERGIGISRLEGIKMFLSLRMYVLTAHTLAAIDAATNKRDVEVTFTDDAMVSQEGVYERIVQNIVKKSSMGFDTVDLNSIQSDISRRGISLKGNNIPGFQQFDISNRPDTRGSQFNFDPDLLGYYDKQINNGMRIPASALQSLDENDYARSLTTTNLFYAMDISMDQDVVVEKLSDFLQIYGRYSEEFRAIVENCLPNKSEKDIAGDGSISKEATGLSVDAIIDSLKIELPAVNLAPTKSQFEILDSMTNSVNSLINAVLPDGIAGDSKEAGAAITALRAHLVQKNIQDLMSSSGMRDYALPNQDLVASLSDIKKFRAALISAGLGIAATDNITEAKPTTDTDDTSTTVSGY